MRRRTEAPFTGISLLESSAQMGTKKQGLFILPDGQDLTFTFILVSSLFFLWAMCNGMIDVMDKHFQEELNLSKAQSAWVQFAHYLGYFLMSIPAGWLATKLGYKRGIIAGLVIVAAGGFWFLPATHINTLAHQGSVTLTQAFIGFLAGVCVIATGLTFLETIANPYTTVLGDPRYAATRINLAQSCNGLGWIFGPPLGNRHHQLTGKILTGIGSGLGNQVQHRALRHDMAAMNAGPRTDIEDVIGGADGIFVVLNHNDGIAEVAQPLERFEEARVVALVQSDRGLIEHVQYAGEAGSDLGCKPDALALAS